MKTRIIHRAALFAGLLLVGLFATPAALAHTNVSIGIGFAGPGFRIGVGDCINCYRGYYRPRYYAGASYYYPAYYPAYYAPAYYAPAYYGPTYYAPAPAYYRSYPVYGTVYYGRGYYYAPRPRGVYWRGGYYHRR